MRNDNFPECPIPAEKPATWDRLPDETDNAYAAFIAYRDLGAHRSARQVAEKYGHGRATYEKWATKYKWVIRAREWDGFVQSQRSKGMADVARECGGEWERRRDRLMGLDYATGLKLFGKARKIMASLDVTPAASSVDGDEGGYSMGGLDEETTTSRPNRDPLKSIKNSTAILKDVAAIIREGSALAWGAVNVALADDALEDRPTTPLSRPTVTRIEVEDDEAEDDST